VTVSVPSFVGGGLAHFRGRHTLHELDIADKQEEIAAAFNNMAKLRPFPNEKPNFGTCLKRDILFSGPMIRLLCKHLVG